MNLIKSNFWKLYRKINRLPNSVSLEACSLCQLNCRDCYMRDYTIGEPVIGNGFLKFEDFKKFLNKNPFIENIELSFSGEIFLNPDLPEIIKFGYKKNKNLTAFNGVNFNNVSDKMLEFLVKYQFKGIMISLDGTSEETYSKYRIKGNFNKVIENIKKLNEFKKRYNSIYPVLTWQYIVFKHNVEEISEIEKLAKKLQFAKVYLKQAWNNEVDIKKLNYNFPLIIDERKEVQEICSLERSSDLCEQLWIYPQINWDGKLMGCCCCTHRAIGGNVFNLGLKKALQHKNMKLIRSVIEGKREPTDNLACYYCYLYKLKKEKNEFINPKKLRFN